MWSKESEEARSSGRESEVFQVWRGRTQEVEMSKERRKEKRGRSSTTVGSVKEGEEVLWGKGTASKRSSNEHGGVDNEMGGGYLCGV